MWAWVTWVQRQEILKLVQKSRGLETAVDFQVTLDGNVTLGRWAGCKKTFSFRYLGACLTSNSEHEVSGI